MGEGKAQLKQLMKGLRPGKYSVASSYLRYLERRFPAPKAEEPAKASVEKPKPQEPERKEGIQDKEPVLAAIEEEPRVGDFTLPIPFTGDHNLKDYLLVLRALENDICRVMIKHPNPFTVSRVVEIAAESYLKTTVFIGHPMKLQHDIAIPVFVKDMHQVNGPSYLTFAYRSESHAVWRRYAGLIAGQYYKGTNESFQDFHWKIQQALDITANAPPEELRHSADRMMRLTDFGLGNVVYSGEENNLNAIELRTILANENQHQEEMEKESKYFEPDEPAKFVDYWWAGNQESVYGTHLKLLLESRNNGYLYGISITPEGIFVSFIHDNECKGINIVGSPNNGIMVPTDLSWIFTPIIEYSRNMRNGTKMEQLASLPDIDINGTIIGIRGERVRIEGLHESSASPLKKLYNAVHDIPRLLRQGSYEAAGIRMQCIKNGIAPLLTDNPPGMPPAEQIEHFAEQRLDTLTAAYGLHLSGRLDDETIKKFQLLPRDVEMIRKYARHREQVKAICPEAPIVPVPLERLRKNAVEWARDICESSAHQTWVGKLPGPEKK